VRWKKATLIGMGLLGGSLGKALRERRLADCVCGFVRRQASVVECKDCGAADLVTEDLSAAVTGADLIVMCTPVAQMRRLLAQMAPQIRRGAVITDVGSVKAMVVHDLEDLARRAEAHFIGSHPMAGSERTGVAAARADLFVGAACVLTPTLQSNGRALKRVTQLWRALGARVFRLSPADHDRLVSRSSHLPYFTAAALAHVVLAPTQPAQLGELCAGGFRDTTRIASGSPEMWRDIARGNRKEIVRAMRELILALQRMRRLIAEGDAGSLEAWLREAKCRRDRWQAKASGTRAVSRL
jgi:prephenate dehydrogenase